MNVLNGLGINSIDAHYLKIMFATNRFHGPFRYRDEPKVISFLVGGSRP